MTGRSRVSAPSWDAAPNGAKGMDNGRQYADGSFSRNVMDVAIKIGVVALIVYWCLDILSPFIVVLLWAAIMAIAFYPLFQIVTRWLGGRPRWAAVLLTLFSIALLLGPITSLGITFVQDLESMLASAKEGSLDVPDPPESIKDWPFIGEKLHGFWSLAATNLDAALHTVQDQVKALAHGLLAGAARTGLGLLQFLLALIVAGFLLTRSRISNDAAVAVAERLSSPENGEKLVRMMEATVRNVSRGVLGTAVIQTFFAGLGMIVAGIPGAALWTVVCLFLAVVQIGPGLVLIPTIIYMFSESSTMAAVIYMLWAVPVMLSDSVLKPVLMGRGSSVPVLVIFIGVVGGTMAYGLIGVFVGPVVLVVGYTLILAWAQKPDSTEEA